MSISHYFSLYDSPSVENQKKIHDFVTGIYTANEEEDLLTAYKIREREIITLLKNKDLSKEDRQKLTDNLIILQGKIKSEFSTTILSAVLDDCPLTEKQIDFIFNSKVVATAAEEVEKKLIAEGYKLKPSAQLGLQLTIGFAAMYYMPGMFGIYAANTVLAKILPKIVGVYAAHTQTIFNLGIQYFASNYSPYALGTMLAQEYGAWVAPASIALYQGSKFIVDSEVAHAAGDFFDIMHGHADDETLAKYEGSWATKDVGELASDVFSGISSGLSWLWSKTQRTPSQTTTTSHAIEPTIAQKSLVKTSFP